ncbi:DNA-binding protein [Pasteurella multocida]|uniref:DNA-binding protein n=1 Tax=Pasteurella multocida TaxID=747 RepID=UPI003B9E4DD2
MRNKKEWFSANELAGVKGLPSSPQGVNKKARTQEWKKRNREGVQGGAVEYHYSSFPESTQKALGFLINETKVEKKEFDLQQRIDLLEQKLQALENKALSVASIKPVDLTDSEWLLVLAFRRCNEDRKLMAISAVEALATQTEKEQKESEILLKDHQVA